MLASPDSFRNAQYYRTVAEALERSENIVIVFDHEGSGDWAGVRGLRIAGYSESFLLATGFQRDSVLGARFPDILGIAPDAVEAVAIRKATGERASLRSEMEIKAADRPAFWFGYHLMPTEHDGFVLLGRDITAQRQERKRHNAAQALLAKVYMVVEVPIAIISADGRMLMTNPAVDRLLGVSAVSLAGTAFLDHVGVDTRQAVGKAMARQLATGGACELDAILHGKDGEIEVRLASTVLDHPDLQRPRVVSLTPPGISPAAPVPRVVVAGKVRLIGLDAVRQALGPRWPAMKERAVQTAEHVVRRRVGAQDSYSRTEDGGIIICFGDLTEEEASFRAAMISREIRQRLIGVEDVPSETNVRAIVTSFPEPEPGAVPLARLIEEQLDGRRAAIEDNARGVLTAALRTLATQFFDVQHRLGTPIARYAQLPAPDEQKIVAALMSLPPGDAVQCDIDLLRLRVVADDLASAAGAATKLPVLLDVSFDVFAGRASSEPYLAHLRGLPPTVRQNVILMISHIPPGVLRGRLTDCARTLRPHVREVGFRVTDLEVPPVEIAPSEQVTIAISHQDLKVDHASEEAIFRFMQSLRAKRGRLLVRDIPTQQAWTMLRELGVDLLSQLQPRA